MPDSTFQQRRATTRKRIVGLLAAVLIVLACVVTICYRTAPIGNTSAQHFDVILVLGTPALREGGISPTGDWLVREAAREYQAGKADHIVMSGGPVANRHVEADVLAHHAEEIGVPAASILEDRRARNTLENVQNTAALMQQHGWTSAEVIGLQEHLPRTAILLETTTSLQWQTHAAATPERERVATMRNTVEEAVGTTVLRVFGVWTVPVLHEIKMVIGLPAALVRYMRGIP